MAGNLWLAPGEVGCVEDMISLIPFQTDQTCLDGFVRAEPRRSNDIQRGRCLSRGWYWLHLTTTLQVPLRSRWRPPKYTFNDIAIVLTTDEEVEDGWC